MPCFYVGNQKLIGRTVKLTKPLAILKQPMAAAGTQHSKVELVAVIRQKVLFDSRPITIMK
jgi:hypothetical protein